MHYDIDFANILHFHFHGKKRCILFPPSETKYLYKVPHALIAREDIDFTNPDFEKFPALKNAKGMFTELKHGETLVYARRLLASNDLSHARLLHEPARSTTKSPKP